MSWMVPKLNQRIQICIAQLVPDTSNEMQSTVYTLVKEIWAELIPVSSYIRAIRSANTESADTHYFKIRKSSMELVGSEFSKAFDSNFDSTSRSNSIKSDWFIKLLRGSAYRLFRITGTQADDQNKEYILIRSSEQEEDR